MVSGSAAARKKRSALAGHRIDFGETKGRGGGLEPDTEMEF